MEEVALRQPVPAIQESPQGSTEVLNLLHRGDFRPGATLPSPALPPAPCEAPRARQRPAAGVPDLPSLRFARSRGDATPRSACRTSPETPLMSEDDTGVAWMRYVVNSVVEM